MLFNIHVTEWDTLEVDDSFLKCGSNKTFLLCISHPLNQHIEPLKTPVQTRQLVQAIGVFFI